MNVIYRMVNGHRVKFTLDGVATEKRLDSLVAHVKRIEAGHGTPGKDRASVAYMTPKELAKLPAGAVDGGTLPLPWMEATYYHPKEGTFTPSVALAGEFLRDKARALCKFAGFGSMRHARAAVCVDRACAPLAECEAVWRSRGD